VTVLEVAALSADRDGRRILDGVSFSVRRGEILGVIGPNGAGKTTLFECVAGLQPIDGGTVSGDKPFYIPDAIRPWPDQSVEWTIGLMARMCGRGQAGAPLPHMDELDLTRLRRQPVRSLSKGETKRLNVALALVTDAPLVLLDEPFDGLDIRQTRQVMELLRRYVAGGGRTLVLSIHQLQDAARICDRLLLLNAGKVVAAGTVAELGDLEELFLART
jgi:ABC-2 type transport system ATP-binding protein